MTSALGEYTPDEFWELLDEYERIAAPPAPMHPSIAATQQWHTPPASAAVEALRELDGLSAFLVGLSMRNDESQQFRDVAKRVAAVLQSLPKEG
jgi:hypothetical protein